MDVALSTVYRVKQRFAEEGLERVLQDRPQANRPRKLDDRGEAHLIALACSPPPEGHDHWTLRLLAGKVVELGLTRRWQPTDMKGFCSNKWFAILRLGIGNR